MCKSNVNYVLQGAGRKRKHGPSSARVYVVDADTFGKWPIVSVSRVLTAASWKARWIDGGCAKRRLDPRFEEGWKRATRKNGCAAKLRGKTKRCKRLWTCIKCLGRLRRAKACPEHAPNARTPLQFVTLLISVTGLSRGALTTGRRCAENQRTPGRTSRFTARILG